MTLPPLTAGAWLRWDVVERLLPPARTVLEIGCGQGGVGARLATRADYLGVEPDQASSATARSRMARLGRGEVRAGLVEDVVEPGRTFDLVCAFEVLEHIEDDAAALTSWLTRVRPGGWLMLSTPAYQNRFGPSDEMVGHFRRYEPQSMVELLAGHGLEDVELVVYGAPLGYALEMARNAVGRRRLACETGRSVGAHQGGSVPAMVARTSRSGRLLQPGAALGLLTRAGTAPFRVLQRRHPNSGTGLVALARRAS